MRIRSILFCAFLFTAAAAAQKPGLEPKVGMTDAEFASMRKTIDEQSSRFLREHAAGDSNGWDPAWSKWGSCHVNRTTTASGAREQWVCGVDREQHYVYVEGGVVTAIQD